MFDRVPSSRLRTERRSTSARGAPPNAHQLLTEPLVDFRLVRGNPLLCRLVGVHMVAGDQLGDRVLIGVRPLPALDESDGWGAARGELLAHELEQRVLRVRTGVRLRVASGFLVVLAAFEAGWKLDQVDLVLRVQVLRVVPVEENRLPLLVELRPARNLGRLRADAHELQVQAERLDQRLVLLLVRRIAAEEHALRARLGTLEERLLALQALPGLELRMLLHQVVRDVPADRADDAVRSDPDHRLLLRHVLVPLRYVTPVLEDRIRLAVRHGLVDGNLGDLRDADLAAKGLLEDVLDDVGVCSRPRPRLLVERDLAATGRRLRSRTPDTQHDHGER